MQTASERSTVALVSELCAALERASVDYCHWKSNAFLDRSRSGENDLDLLVRRSDADRFGAVVQEMSFKAVESPSALPGVSHFYGFDVASPRLVHLHVHYQLIVGDDLTKNYRLPLEQAFLDGSVRDGEFRIAPPELEMIALVLRVAIKHSTWDAALRRRTRLPKSTVDEIDFLVERSEWELVRDALARDLPFLDPASFSEFFRSLTERHSAWRRVRSGQRLVRQLAACSRRPRAVDVGLKVSRHSRAIARRLARKRPARKRFAAGGALIAIVGADGAGKSTVVEAVCAWLARDFSVTRVHLGRPPASWPTRAVRMLAKVRSGAARLTHGRTSGGGSEALRSKLRMLHAVALARDRYREYRRARRLATNGGIVLCDRFPLPELTSMDAPRVDRIAAGGTPTRLTRFLAARERRYYAAVSRPDVLVVLRVDPDLAVARKPDEPPDFVRARWSEMWSIDWRAAGGHVVDASLPAADVVDEVKRVIWSRV